MFAVIWTLINIIQNARFVGFLKIFDTVWIWFDIFYVIGNGLISINALSSDHDYATSEAFGN